MRISALLMTAQSDLESLARTLSAPGMPSQAEIARAVGVDQPFVSRAARCELRRITPRVARLQCYANMRFSQLVGEMGVTGEYDELHNPIVMKALEACREYLAGGFDPEILFEQVELLARAQRLKFLGKSKIFLASVED